ncbi:MAG: NADP-dependent oxidoreductase [Actinobacteria bacterium]|nr:NADP-dependent oxidoreductase [Actinomycetota bacterium]
MASPLVNRRYYLQRRPQGLCTESDLQLVREEIPDLKPGQALVRTLYLSLDPTLRAWMSDHRSYMPPSPVGAVMRGLGIGQVVDSRRDDLTVGALVAGLTGWQDYCVADDDLLELPFTVLPDPLPAPLPAFLGVLGVTGGITAYIGMDIVQPRPGETVVVSAAAGSVGSVAGQIAKAKGARVVGIAGGPQKCRHVTADLRFDACVDYQADNWSAQLDAATPAGVDVNFENVGGDVLDQVLLRLNIGARIALCGMISQYNHYNSVNESPNWPPQYHIIQLVMQRASIHGFLVLDHADRFAEATEYLAGLINQGKLTYRETIINGLENAIEAHNLLYTGGNTGKLLLKLAEPA